MGSSGICYRRAHFMVRHEQMARRLCLQNNNELVDFCLGGIDRFDHRIADGKLAEF